MAGCSSGRLGAVVLSVLAHNYDDAMQVLLLLTGRQVKAPFLISAGRIAKSGHVMADMVTRFGTIARNQAFFTSTRAMEGEFRRLADTLKLSDQDRVEMFAAVRRWVVCDYRIDPTMNPADPDAKRLVN